MQRTTSGVLVALLFAVASCGFAATAQAAPPQQLCSGEPIRVVEVFESSGLVVPSAAWTFRGSVVGTGGASGWQASCFGVTFTFTGHRSGKPGHAHTLPRHPRTIPCCWWPGTVS